MCRAAGVLAGVPALCPGGGPALEDLRAPPAVRPVRGEPCAAACVHAGLAAGCGRDHNALLLEAIAALASLLGAPGPHPSPAAPPHVATGTCQNMNTECCRLMCSVRDVQFGGDFWRGQVGRQVAQHAQFASAQWLNRRPGPGAGTIDASDGSRTSSRALARCSRPLPAEMFRTFIQVICGGAGGARTHDRRIMTSTAPCAMRPSCADGTSYRTDGTRRAGIN